MSRARIVKPIALVAMFVIVATPLYASDWDIAGKILTGIEGTRILTGGRVDFIGALAGINNNHYRDCESHYAPQYRRFRRDDDYCTRVWIPTTVWEREWIPTHKEYDHGREIIVKGHYVEREVETGGYWQTNCPYQKDYRYSRYRR